MKRQRLITAAVITLVAFGIGCSGQAPEEQAATQSARLRAG